MFLRVLEHERVAAEDGSDEDLEFHVREVLTHTHPMIHENGFGQVPSTSGSKV